MTDSSVGFVGSEASRIPRSHPPTYARFDSTMRQPHPPVVSASQLPISNGFKGSDTFRILREPPAARNSRVSSTKIFIAHSHGKDRMGGNFNFYLPCNWILRMVIEWVACNLHFKTRIIQHASQSFLIILLCGSISFLHVCQKTLFCFL